MRKLSDMKDEEALDLFASLFEPLQDIYNDEEVRKSFKTKNASDIAKAISKSKPDAVKKIMATLDGEDVDGYHYSFMLLIIRIMEILNDKELTAFFI